MQGNGCWTLPGMARWYFGMWKRTEEKRWMRSLISYFSSLSTSVARTLSTLLRRGCIAPRSSQCFDAVTFWTKDQGKRRGEEFPRGSNGVGHGADVQSDGCVVSLSTGSWVTGFTQAPAWWWLFIYLRLTHVICRACRAESRDPVAWVWAWNRWYAWKVPFLSCFSFWLQEKNDLESP